MRQLNHLQFQLFSLDVFARVPSFRVEFKLDDDQKERDEIRRKHHPSEDQEYKEDSRARNPRWRNQTPFTQKRIKSVRVSSTKRVCFWSCTFASWLYLNTKRAQDAKTHPRHTISCDLSPRPSSADDRKWQWCLCLWSRLSSFYLPRSNRYREQWGQEQHKSQEPNNTAAHDSYDGRHRTPEVQHQRQVRINIGRGEFSSRFSVHLRQEKGVYLKTLRFWLWHFSHSMVLFLNFFWRPIFPGRCTVLLLVSSSTMNMYLYMPAKRILLEFLWKEIYLSTPCGGQLRLMSKRGLWVIVRSFCHFVFSFSEWCITTRQLRLKWPNPLCSSSTSS